MVKKEYGFELLDSVESKKFEAVVLAVAHAPFEQIDFELLKAENAIVYDVKGFLKDGVDGRL